MTQPAPRVIGTCATCLYYDPASVDATDGLCRCKAPAVPLMVNLASQLGQPAIWPRVRATEWCGEFEVKV